MRVFIGEEYVLTYRLIVIVGVVACAAFVMSPVLVPIGRWCMKVKRTDWTRSRSPRPSMSNRGTADRTDCVHSG